jgi:hypothetical protein
MAPNMINRRIILSATRRLAGAVARCALAPGAFLCAALIGLGQEPAHPLKPPDRSSPRAALKTFLDAGDALGAFLAKDYLPSPSRKDFHQLVLLGDAAEQYLDLSAAPPHGRQENFGEPRQE